MCVRIGFSWLFLQHEQLTKSLSQRINYCFSRCFSTSKLEVLALHQRAWVWHAANLFLFENPPCDGRAQHDKLSRSEQGKHLQWVRGRWKLTLTLITPCIQSQWIYYPEESALIGRTDVNSSTAYSSSSSPYNHSWLYPSWTVTWVYAWAKMSIQ